MWGNYLNRIIAYALVALVWAGGHSAHATDDFVDGIDFKFDDECRNAQANAGGLGRLADPNGNQYNSKCSHEWAYQNGNSIYYVYEKHAQKKADKVDKSTDLQSLVSDGICLPVETLPECKSRVKREALNASVEAREKSMEFNKARMDLLIDRSVLNAGDTAPKSNYSVLQDFYRAAKKSSAKQFRVLGTRDVNFNMNGRNDPSKAKLQTVKQEQIVNPKHQMELGVETQKVLEVGSNVKDAALEKKMAKELKGGANGKSVYSAKKYQEDNKRLGKYEQQLQKQKQPVQIRVQNNVSVEAFKDVMDDVQNSVIQSGAASRTPSSKGQKGLENEDPDRRIYAAPPIDKSNGSGALDYEIEKNLMNSVDPSEP